MEKVNGVELSQKWPEMSLHAKFKLARAITSLDQAFVRKAFTSIDSIYFAEELGGLPQSRQLFAEAQPDSSGFAKYAIGPTTSRRFLTGGRGSIDVHRGPCKTWRELSVTQEF